MYLPPEARTHAAIAFPHDIAVRVEVWHGTSQLGAFGTDQILSGTVTDQWVSGLRRTLDITVEPTKQWREWLKIGVELRPFRGVKFGPNDIEDCPLGCFPVRKFTHQLGGKTPTPVRAQDRWQQVIAYPIPYPIRAYRGKITDAAARLIREVDPYTPAVKILSLSLQNTAAVQWDKTRAETIADLLTSIGAEAFYDRLGRPVIQNVPYIRGTHVGILKPKRGGTVHALTDEIDWESTVNKVGVYSTATNTTLKPVVVGVSNTASPAHRWNISGGGSIGGWQAVRYASPLFTDRQQMIDAAKAILQKGSGPARQFTMTVTPHPGYDASDTVLVQTDLDSDDPADMELAQIKQVTHPLSAGDAQQITTMTIVDSTIEE